MKHAALIHMAEVRSSSAQASFAWLTTSNASTNGRSNFSEYTGADGAGLRLDGVDGRLDLPCLISIHLSVCQRAMNHLRDFLNLSGKIDHAALQLKGHDAHNLS